MASSDGNGKQSAKGNLFIDPVEGNDPLARRSGSFRDGYDFSQPSSTRTNSSSNTLARSASMRVTPRYSVKERQKITSETEDPLAQKVADDYDPVQYITKENLSIRKEDEARIVASLHNAAKKQCTGSIYSVVVDIGKSGTLGIGVKDLADSVLAVSLLKRENCCPGAGEDAGIRLGDIIFGINFIPTREGSKTLISILKKEVARGKSHIHVQGWRCHQLCSDPMPGYQFERADEVLVQAYSLVESGVFSDWERWNFIEILLGHMLEDLRMRSKEENGLSDSAGTLISPSVALRAKQMQVLDLERNIMQAKGLRTALCVRIVHTKSQGDVVVYVLRVEDVESGLQWVVQRRYSDFFALNEELLDMSHFAREVEFPRKRLSIRNTAKLVEMRIVALEQYMRRMLHILTSYATMDAAASRTLRHLQNFLGVDNYLDCVHPPVLDDQRFIELMAYRFLNDFGSEACQQCVRFITTVDLEAPIEPGPEGYQPVLNFMRDALSEVEQFVQQQHMSQMVQVLGARRPDLTEEQLQSFVRKCIRRQVEAALYLPLRRTVFRIVFSFLAAKSKSLQRAITLLQRATPQFLMVDPCVVRAPSLPRTVKAFRRVIQAYLPADQGQLLIQAATSVMDLHKECQLERNRQTAAAAVAATSASAANPSTDPVEVPPEQPLEISQRTGSDEVDFSFVSTRTPNLEIGMLPSTTSEDSRKIVSTMTDDELLPEPPKRPPVTTKLRELFTRKKTAEDLFASSDSETEKVAGSPSPSPSPSPVRPQTGDSRRSSWSRERSWGPNQSLGLTGMEDTATISPRTGSVPSAASSAPGTPGSLQRPTGKFIQRLLPRPGAKELHDPDTPDNLFVDENQAFAVSVKRSDSAQDLGTANSVASSPPSRNMSSTHLPTDTDLSTIQKHITTLKDGSSNGNPIAKLVRESSVTAGSIDSPLLAHSEDALMAALARSPSPPAPPATNQDEPVGKEETRPLPPTPSPRPIGKAVAWREEPSGSAHRPDTSEVGNEPSTASPPTTERSVSTSGLDHLVLRNSEMKKATLPHLHPALLSAEEAEEAHQRLEEAGDTLRRLSPAASAEDLDGQRRDELSEQLHAYHNHSRDSFGRLGREDESREGSREGRGADAGHLRDSIVINNCAEEVQVHYDAISADDFLPLFTYVLIQAGLPQLLLVKELMTALVNDEDSYGECGYYLATLEAATQHIFDLAGQFEKASADVATAVDGQGDDTATGLEEKIILP